MNREPPYNPLDRKNLGKSVAEALLARTPVKMAALQQFAGAGIYAIYYVGGFQPYHFISERNRDNRFEWPIYIGKAVPSGARKGGPKKEDGEAGNGKGLFKRLKEHAQSIKEATNLDLADFYCRYLILEDIWIPLGESLLIARFSPLWNLLIDGYGNHNPGKGRVHGMLSRWDVLHPGRPWTPKYQPRNETADQISAEVEAYLKTAPVPPANRQSLF